jgi:hypothetical protein
MRNMAREELTKVARGKRASQLIFGGNWDSERKEVRHIHILQAGHSRAGGTFNHIGN